MRIKKLELFGFKSFAERQVLHFDAGITGVVGPNGCGKSNIVDALLWVMGEHNAKNLRGSNMQDIIFNGSQNRSPLGFAEVVLTLENDGQNVPPEYENFHEIEITRRLYRGGDSEFEINKRACRLKDITDLFLGTGVGSRAYSIIEQGRVGQIISAKPEDRRHIIDEAAGITKYKSKRAAAERKIEETKINLSRISDIAAELDTRLAVLDKQAKKAKRYKSLKEEIKGKDYHHAALRWLEISAQERFTSMALSVSNQEIEAAEIDLAHRQGNAEESKAAQRQKEEAVNLSQKLFYEAQNTFALAHKDLAFLHKELESKKLQERSVHDELKRIHQRLQDTIQEQESVGEQISATAALMSDAAEQAEAATEELAAVQQRHLRQRELTILMQNKAQSAATDATTKQVELRAWQEKHEAASQRCSNLALEKIQLSELVAAADGKIIILRREIDAGRSKKATNDELIAATTALLENNKSSLKNSRTTVENLARSISQKSSRLASLEEIDGSYEWTDNKLGEFLAAQPKTAILGIVADFIDVPAEIEGAAEIALKQVLESVVLANLNSLATMCKQLSDQSIGRIRLYPSGAGGAVDQFVDDLGISLFKYVQKDCDSAAVRSILTRILLVDSIELALSRWEWAQKHKYTLVTRDGVVFSDDGSVTSGKPIKSSGLLRRKREIRELVVELSMLKIAEIEQLAQLENFNSERDQLVKKIEGLDQENRSISQGISSLQESLGAKSGELQSLRHKQENLAREELEIGTFFDNAQEQNESRNQHWAAALERHKNILGELEEAQSELEDIEIEMAAQRELNTVVKVKLAEISGKLNNLRDNDRRMTENIVECGHRLENLTRQADELASTQHDGAAQAQGLSERIEEVGQECAVIEQRLERQKAEHALISAHVNDLEAEIEQSRTRLRIGEIELNDFKLALQGHRQVRLGIDERIFEKYGATVKDFLTDYHLLFVPVDELDKELQALRRSLDNLGTVNPNAEEEFDELNGRYVFLKAQGDDLGQALEQLQEAIVKINKATTKCFAESFAAINTRFSQVFPRLFNGGKAWLALTNPEDLLNTGVEIYAEPPGKKLGSIALMSGGEKALTATSLIFAIFLIKPSPFCLLDEVDAPLDEANVQRFSQLVQEISAISQFIVITHNKKTMEGAKKLYGITMETPGVSKTVSVNLTQRKKADVPEGKPSFL